MIYTQPLKVIVMGAGLVSIINNWFAKPTDDRLQPIVIGLHGKLCTFFMLITSDTACVMHVCGYAPEYTLEPGVYEDIYMNR